MVFCLGEPPGGFYDVGCYSSFIVVFVMLFVVVFTFPGYIFHATGTPPWLLRPVNASTCSELYPGYFRLLYFSVTFLLRALRFWVGIFFYPQAFFVLLSFPIFLPQTCFYPGLGFSSSLTFAGLHADPRNTGPAHLFVWFTVICNLDIQKNSH